MLSGWLPFHRQCSHIPWQLGWGTTVWSRFKTWEKSVCSSPHFVSLELPPAQRLGWAHAKPGLLSGWILSWISVPAVQAHLSETNPGIQNVTFSSCMDSPDSDTWIKTHPWEWEDSPGTASISELAPNTYFQLQTLLNGMQDWKFLPRNREQEAFQENPSLRD